jgi:hypothetical protein
VMPTLVWPIRYRDQRLSRYSRSVLNCFVASSRTIASFSGSPPAANAETTATENKTSANVSFHPMCFFPATPP